MNVIEAVQTPDPYSLYSELISQKPFSYDEPLGLWIAADAESVEMVLNSKDVGVRPAGQDIPKGIDGTAAGEVFGQLIRMRDDEYHDQLKEAIKSALGAVGEEEVIQIAKNITRESINTEINLNSLIFRIPILVMSELCGLKLPISAEMVELIDKFVKCIPASATEVQINQAALAATRLKTIFYNEFQSSEIGGLLLEIIKSAENLGWQSQTHLIANSIGLFSQTYEATAGLVGNTLVALKREKVDSISDFDLKKFITEVTRHDSPIQNTRRFCIQTFRYREYEVQSGDQILVLLGAANRDGAINEKPHDFYRDRIDPKIFTFGLNSHMCPGSVIAKSITHGIVSSLVNKESKSLNWSGTIQYVNSPNARIPVFVS